MSEENSLFGIHANALRLRSERMAVLASNIANASTPNYKARDFNFVSALDAAQADPTHTPRLHYRVPVQASLDGNTVELPTEQLEFTENAIAYRSSLSFLNSRISTVMRALKGE